jgi:hypothetical protein
MIAVTAGVTRDYFFHINQVLFIIKFKLKLHEMQKIEETCMYLKTNRYSGS